MDVTEHYREVRDSARRVVRLSCAASLACTLLSMAAPSAAAAPAGNAAVVRWAKGTYEYGKLDSDLIRGHEDWTLTVHPDGTRTLQAFVNVSDGGHQTNAILRVGSNFRPLDGFVSFWRGGVYGGAGWYRLDGENLVASVAGPRGVATHTIGVPQRLSLRLHPVSIEGWQVWPYDQSRDGPQQGALYNVVTIGSPPVPGIGVLLEHRIDYHGQEDVTVPAGSFTADHYSFYDGRYDIWLWGPDRVLIRYANFGNGNEYRLVAFQTSP